MNSRKIFSTGIIGTGRIGFLLEDDPLRQKPCTHAGGISKNKNLKITCACDINPERLAYFGKRYKVDKLYGDYKEMLDKERPDLAVIAVKTEKHKEITIEAAKRKTRVIVCEKPMAFNSKDCRAMIKACEKNKSILLVNHERRYDPLYRKTKEMIKQGMIGEVRTVLANILTNPGNNKKSFDPDRSSLLHDGTHLIDIASFLFGKPAKVMGFTVKKRKDTVYGFIEFPHGIRFFIEAGGDRKYFNFELDIQGSEGKIRVGNGYKEFYKPSKSRWYSGFQDLKKGKFPFFQDKNFFIEEYKEVVQILRNKVKVPVSSGDDGLQTIEIIEKLTK